jgi:DNA polymerase III alpha subunit
LIKGGAFDFSCPKRAALLNLSSQALRYGEQLRQAEKKRRRAWWAEDEEAMEPEARLPDLPALPDLSGKPEDNRVFEKEVLGFTLS